MEEPKDGDSVCFHRAFGSCSLLSIITSNYVVESRSTLPDGVRTKKWEDRMEKTKKEKAIKLLQAELSEEKKAEITRYVRSFIVLQATWFVFLI